MIGQGSLVFKVDDTTVNDYGGERNNEKVSEVAPRKKGKKDRERDEVEKKNMVSLNDVT